MSVPTAIKLIAENLSDEARALAPGEGRRTVEVDAVGLRTWLDHFAALPAFETEEAEARLQLTVASRRLVVRWAGTRLGAEEGGNFVAATPEEIVALLLAPKAPAGEVAPAEVAPEETLASRQRARARGWLLVGLVVIFAGLCWWTTRPEVPDGVEWIDDSVERQTILSAAAGSYASEDEKLELEAAAGRLTAADAGGNETLRTTVRVGRRDGTNVLVTEAGVVLELVAEGRVKINGIEYRR